MAFLNSRSEELKAAEVPNLMSFCSRHEAKTDKELKFGQNFLSRKWSTLSEEQQAEIERFEIECCNPDTEPGRLKQEAAIERQFDKFISFLKSREQELAAVGPPSLLSFCSRHESKTDKDLKSGQNFLTRVSFKLRARKLQKKFQTHKAARSKD